MAKAAACNRHQSLDQQLCRWLLLSLDRLRSNELLMTPELIPNMLGVRGEGVTKAALHLQAAGLIRYARGRISALNREGRSAAAGRLSVRQQTYTPRRRGQTVSVSRGPGCLACHALSRSLIGA